MGVEHGDKGDGAMNVYGCNARRSEKLAPCPFCGNDATFVEYKGGYLVKCPACDCMMAYQISITGREIVPFSDEEHALGKWNHRLGGVAHGRRYTGGAQEEILDLRNYRVSLIVDVFRRRAGETVMAGEIASDTGLTPRQVNNLMHYIKQNYPQVKGLPGRGYVWEE